MFDVTAITGSFGAEVSGVDLSRPLGEAERAELWETLLAYKLLVFRGQEAVGPRQLADLARNYGEPEVHPYHKHHDDDPSVAVLETDGGGRFSGYVSGDMVRPAGLRGSWHTDGCTRARPAYISILEAVVIPPAGRDTVFADMEAVFAGLSEPTQRYVESLHALHSWGAQDPDAPPVEHPVVVVNEFTGRKALYVNTGYTRGIVGMTNSHENDEILEFLCSLSGFPEYQARLHWEPGTIAMWDNQNTQHYLVQDVQFPRVMHRVMFAPEQRGAFSRDLAVEAVLQ
jgi:taurine dioxygenase